MQITLDIPNNQVTRMIDAFATYYNYQEIVVGNVDENPKPVPNPVSKGQFAKQKLIEHIKKVVQEVERQEAVKSVIVNDLEVI